MVTARSWLKTKDPASMPALLSLPIQILHLFLLALVLLSQPFQVRAGGSIPPSTTALSGLASASSSQPITLVSPPSGAVFMAGLSLTVQWILNLESAPSSTINNTFTTTSTNAFITTTSTNPPLTQSNFLTTTSTFDTFSSAPTDVSANEFLLNVERRSDPTTTPNATLDIYLSDSNSGSELIQLATGVDANAEFWSFSVPSTQKFSKWYYIVVHLHQHLSATSQNANATVLSAGPFTIMDRDGKYFFLTGPDPGRSGSLNAMGVAGETFTISWYSEVPGLQTVDIVLNSTSVGGSHKTIASGVDIDVGRYPITSDMLSGMANGTYWVTLYARGQGGGSRQLNWWARDGPYRIGSG